jgi:hypothetical protein
MAVRYFCDNCGTESREGELTVMVISIPPKAETFEVCAACAEHMTGELDRCRAAKRDRELAVAHAPSLAAGEQSNPILRYGAAILQAPGVAPLARIVSYAAVFVAFFVALTVLTTLR